jgi:hypothetical protein
MGMFINDLMINTELGVMKCTFNGFECVYNFNCHSLTMIGSIGGTKEQWVHLHNAFRELYISYTLEQEA